MVRTYPSWWIVSFTLFLNDIFVEWSLQPRYQYNAIWAHESNRPKAMCNYCGRSWSIKLVLLQQLAISIKDQFFSSIWLAIRWSYQSDQDARRFDILYTVERHQLWVTQIFLIPIKSSWKKITGLRHQSWGLALPLSRKVNLCSWPSEVCQIN